MRPTRGHPLVSGAFDPDPRVTKPETLNRQALKSLPASFCGSCAKGDQLVLRQLPRQMSWDKARLDSSDAGTRIIGNHRELWGNPVKRWGLEVSDSHELGDCTVKLASLPVSSRARIDDFMP